MHSILAKNQQARIVYHLVNVSGIWRCNFYSVAMIPLNEAAFEWGQKAVMHLGDMPE